MWPAISKRSVLGFLIFVMSIPFELAQHPCLIYIVVQKYEEKSKHEIFDARNSITLSIINGKELNYFPERYEDASLSYA